MTFTKQAVGWSKFLGRVRKDAITLPAAKLSAIAAVSTTVSLLATPVLTRLYGAEPFGILGVFSAVLAVTALVSTGRYDQAIALPVEDEEAVALLRLCRRTATIVGCVVLSVAIAGYLFAERLRHPEMTLWLWALPGAVWLSGMTQAQTAWAIRRAHFGALALARLALVIATVGVQFALIGGGALGLLAGLLAGLVMQAIILGRVASARAEPAPGLTGRIAKRHRRFPLFVLPASVLDALTMQIPVLLGGAWFGLSFAGMYLLGAKVLGLPAALVGGPFGQVFYQEFSRYTTRPVEARRILFHAWLKLAAIGAVPLLLLAYAGEPLFAYVFGASWQPAGAIASVLSPMFFAMFVSSPTSGALLALGGQHLAPVFSVCFLIYRVAAFWWGAHLNDYLFGLALVGAAEIATIVIYNGLILRRLGRISA